MTVHFHSSHLADGAMGQTHAITSEEEARRRAWIAAQNSDTLPPVMLTSAHSNEIAVVTTADAGTIISDVDGLMTSDVRLPLVVTHQDCVPVLLTDDRAMIGLLHAGWRGVVAGILPHAITLAAEEFGVAPHALRVHFGAGIRPCHFIVDETVAEQFSSFAVTRNESGIAVDLHAALMQQAENCGVIRSAITKDSRCTYCAQEQGNHVFFSWRRDKIPETNMVSVAWRDETNG